MADSSLGDVGDEQPAECEDESIPRTSRRPPTSEGSPDLWRLHWLLTSVAMWTAPASHRQICRGPVTRQGVSSTQLGDPLPWPAHGDRPKGSANLRWARHAEVGGDD